jgi:hypothetical protein
LKLQDFYKNIETLMPRIKELKPMTDPTFINQELSKEDYEILTNVYFSLFSGFLSMVDSMLANTPVKKKLGEDIGNNDFPKVIGMLTAWSDVMKNDFHVLTYAYEKFISTFAVLFPDDLDKLEGLHQFLLEHAEATGTKADAVKQAEDFIKNIRRTPNA